MARPMLNEEHHRQRGTVARPNQKRYEKAAQAEGVVAGRPRCPAHVKEDSAAFAAWRDALRIMRKNGTLSAGDAPTLSVYAVVTSKWIQATKDVRERGFEVVETRTRRDGSTYETTTVNPSVKIATDCERQLLQLAKALGLTPDSRSRVMPAKEKKAKKFTPKEGSVFAEFPHLFNTKGEIQ